MTRTLLSALLAGVALSACTLAPPYERPALPIAQSWPTPVAASAQGVSADTLAWREVFQDPRLQGVIELALAQNRDLRVAVLNIERARAQYGVQRAALLPGINGVVSGSKGRTPAALSQTGAAVETEQYSATVGFSAYELDLFGRVRSLNQAALQNFFATEENRRAAQISLIAETASTWLTLAADEDQLQLSRDTLKSRVDALDLTQKRFDAGATSALELRQAQTLAEQSRTDVAAFEAQVGQDRNALRLVVGADIPAELAPAGGLVTAQILPDLPVGLPSDVLARRPDVLSAEHVLQGQNANIGAARAAFFPRISLTAATGVASPDLDGLFSSGGGTWSFAPQISLPIFAGGANVANLKGARASRDIAVAQYEKAVQTAFREVADALAVRATVSDRVSAQERLVAAAGDSQRLSRARYDSGVDSYLTLLDAQRTYYAAQQSLISARLVRANNLVTLYKALGGGGGAV
ncbi:MAG: efflux system, outer rane lipoprotein NodT family [Caulobacter sp.]|nr:efflux system, outer rane lipoprotein NodT family [Caulobacter sp.]